MPRHAFIAAIASLSLLGAIAACSRPAPRVHTVKIQNFVFTPAELTVAGGDTVIWLNTDFVPHSTTARDSAWDSKAIEANGSWRFAMRDAGRYDYYCILHPVMKGTIVVR